ncbi:DMT family transporter [Candidatus Gottesmanbacteria bacterium]|nr:DMT family transporter [Candidatus Gottesmanbacteria bacterium]
MAILFALMSMFFWGLALFLAAIASRKIGNILTLFWMQIFGFVIGSIYFLFGPNLVNLNLLTPFIPILAVFALLQVIGTLGYYKGMIKGQVSLVSPLGASYGLITAVLSIVFLKEVLRLNQIIAIFLIIVGIIILSISLKDVIKNKSIQLLTGTKEGIIAMLGWGVSLFLLIFPSKYLGWFLPAIFSRLLMILILLAYILYSKLTIFPKEQKLPFKLLIFIGLFDMLAFFSYSLGVSKGFGSIIGPVSSASTLVTIFLGLIFLKEKLSVRKIIGILAIVGGLILISV